MVNVFLWLYHSPIGDKWSYTVLARLVKASGASVRPSTAGEGSESRRSYCRV